MPELSIIVPVYKVEPYLSKCIDSILAQTFTDFELILIDDGSPDRCGEICDEYAAKDSRIVVIHQENKGVSAARNAGLDVAKGNYIGFVDSDDWIEPEMYQCLINDIDSKSVDISICGINCYDIQYVLLRTDLVGEAVLQRDELLKALYGKPNKIGGYCLNKLFSRKVIGNNRFQTQIRMAEDWLFLFMCFKNAESAYHGSYAKYNLLERPDSATRKNEIDAYYRILFEGKTELLHLARNYSIELERIAVDKYLDDCIRYSNIIRQLGKKTGGHYYYRFIRSRFQVIKCMPRIIIKKLLPKEKICGYIYAAIKD